MGLENNIDEFNQCAAIVLRMLHDAFPIPRELNSSKLQLFNEPDRSLSVFEDISPGSGDPKNLMGKFTAYMWTIEFLIQEGLIRNVQKEKEKELLESHDRGAFRPRGVSLVFPRVVLTANGLAMLNVTPKILKGQPLTEVAPLV